MPHSFGKHLAPWLRRLADSIDRGESLAIDTAHQQLAEHGFRLVPVRELPDCRLPGSPPAPRPRERVLPGRGQDQLPPGESR